MHPSADFKTLATSTCCLWVAGARKHSRSSIPLPAHLPHLSSSLKPPSWLTSDTSAQTLVWAHWAPSANIFWLSHSRFRHLPPPLGWEAAQATLLCRSLLPLAVSSQAASCTLPHTMKHTTLLPGPFCLRRRKQTSCSRRCSQLQQHSPSSKTRCKCCPCWTAGLAPPRNRSTPKPARHPGPRLPPPLTTTTTTVIMNQRRCLCACLQRPQLQLCCSACQRYRSTTPPIMPSQSRLSCVLVLSLAPSRQYAP